MLSLQSPTQRLSGLPSLLVADVGIAHRGADIFVRSNSWISRKSFPT
jgi:hypothetical protein